MRFPVLGVGGVPATGVQSVVLNMTVAEPTQGGFVTIYPTGEARPTASNLNFAAGETVPNLVQARVGVDGTVEAFLNAGSSHLIADVVGWFASNAETRPGARIEPQSPERLLDTRPASRVGPHGPVGRGQTIEVQVVPARAGLHRRGPEPDRHRADLEHLRHRLPRPSGPRRPWPRTSTSARARPGPTW